MSVYIYKYTYLYNIYIHTHIHIYTHHTLMHIRCRESIFFGVSLLSPIRRQN